MSGYFSFLLRQPCPPGACECDHEALRADIHGDQRILRLTREEEKKLLTHLEEMRTYQDLQRMQQRMQEQLGIVLTITPSARGVRTVRGLNIRLEEQRGLCRKTRQTIPAAIRRCLENNQAIAFALVDAHDLLAPTQEAHTIGTLSDQNHE
ncbi:hypothetical protein [uncultured Oxalicibacterium sp.]|uniref:hypothetical protein n=1 Tax=uncultured Oxalicibacterium sp. TaxID=1168540 RepID=UPI0025E20DBC|nr:hypothetical protein [uncultured Oxalicibacterium sp.]